MDIEEKQDPWLTTADQTASFTFFRKHVVEFSDKAVDAVEQFLFAKPIFHSDNGERELDDSDSSQEPINQGVRTDKDTEALYDPLEDDDNDQWIRKTKSPSGDPIVCPGCFRQLAYMYRKEEKGEQLQYRTEKVFGVVVREDKIIRRNDLADRMDWCETELDQQERQLHQRQADINVRIVCQCQCGIPIGFYDINRQQYVLTEAL